MKKMFSLALSALMLLSLLAACGGTEAPPAEEGGEEAAAEGGTELQILETAYAVEDYAIAMAKEDTALVEEVNAALQTIKENGTQDAIVAKYIEGTAHDLQFQQEAEGKPELIMATNAAFPPYEFYEGDKIVGIDAEMAAAIADEMGRKLVIDDMEFDSIITAISTGKADIGMAGMTVTEDRLQSVNFSESYATGIQSIIVPVGSDITTVDDLLAGEQLIGVQNATTGDIYASGDFGDERVMKYPKGADAIQALVTGKVDCVIIDNEPAKAFVEANNA